MKTLYMKFLPTVVLSLFLNIGHAQTNYEDFIKISEQGFNQEKIYLDFDKDFYSAGDEIWMRCYVFNGYQLSNLSKRVYIELLDENKVAREKQVYALSAGSTNATIKIPNDLPENIYYVRAYTKLIVGTDYEQKAIYPIKVYNKEAKQFLTEKWSENYSVSVHPEGGKGFIDKNSKYVIRLSDHLNPNLKWKAEVYNSTNNEKIKDVEVYDANVGSFYLKPRKNISYTVKIIPDQGEEKIIPITNIFEKGVSFEITSKEEGIRYNFKAINSDESLKGYKIIGTHNNKIIYSADVNSNTSEVSKFLNSQTFKDYHGIITFSLFDSRKLKIAERLLFIKDSYDKIRNKNSIAITTSLQKRGENEILLPTDESTYHIKVRSQTSEKQDNFYSALWLSKDFKGTIVNPKNYFNNHSNYQALDALLMTEKWERFTTNSYAQPEGLELVYKGKLNYINNSIGNLNLNLVLYKDNSILDIMQKRVNDKGEFLLDNLAFDGELFLNYHINSKNPDQIQNDKLSLTLLPNFSFSPYKNQLPKTNYLLSEKADEARSAILKKIDNISVEKELFNASIIKLQEVVIKKDLSNKTKELNEKLSSSLYNNYATQTIIDLINNDNIKVGYSNISNFITFNVPGIRVVSEKGTLNFLKSNLVYKIYIDEAPYIGNIDDILTINDVAMIKVLHNDGIVDNAILIYTKRTYLPDSYERSKSNQIVKIKGYDEAKEYMNNEALKEVIYALPQDTREVLSWNTIFLTNPENNKIIYFSNDTPKNNVIEIIGNDKFGNITTFTKEVER